jgi:hypothetical protein
VFFSASFLLFNNPHLNNRAGSRQAEAFGIKSGLMLAHCHRERDENSRAV